MVNSGGRFGKQRLLVCEHGALQMQVHPDFLMRDWNPVRLVLNSCCSCATLPCFSAWKQACSFS
eukprot:2518970-Amphidinium_carterae.1